MRHATENGEVAVQPRPKRTKKLSGADIELGNFILNNDGDSANSCYQAASAVLAATDGIPANNLAYARTSPACGYDVWDPGTPPGSGYRSSTTNLQDQGRKFLTTNGSSVYIDLGHFEMAAAETGSARDHVAMHKALLGTARQSLARANAALPVGQRIVLLANNSDGRGASYGGHLNMLVTRSLWNDIFRNKVFPSLFVLCAHQVSSICYTGQGKVGAENHRPRVPFQLTQRGDFFECLVAERTTFMRPIVNSRDEAHCGVESPTVANQLARLHVIFYDTNLADTSTYLKVGVMQLVLAMLEADRGNDSLILEDPLSALLHWGHDPELRATARLLDGKRVTAVELQLSFLEAARACAEHGVFDGYVEDAGDILDLWEDTLLKLQERDFHALSARLDWVIKRAIIERAIAREPGMTWESPRAKFLDLMYSCISAEEGLFWQLEQAGLVQRLVSDADVAKLASLPPEDTRAWTRATLLGIAGAEQVERIDWDTIAFRLQGVDGVQRKVLKLADPQAFTRASVLPLISEADSLAGLLDALGAVDVPSGNGAGGTWTTTGSRFG